jgi:Haem-binding domain
VQLARAALNLSDWAETNGRRPGTSIGALAAACAGVEAALMPPRRYLLMHPEARVSKEEAQTFCAWTTAEIRQIKAESMAIPGQ